MLVTGIDFGQSGPLLRPSFRPMPITSGLPVTWDFTWKTGECLWISGNFIRQELEGQKTMEPCVFGLVDHSHSAATQLFDTAIVRNGLTDHGVGVW